MQRLAGVPAGQGPERVVELENALFSLAMFTRIYLSPRPCYASAARAGGERNCSHLNYNFSTKLLLTPSNPPSPPGPSSAAAASGRRVWTTVSDHLQSFRVYTGPGGQHGPGPAGALAPQACPGGQGRSVPRPGRREDGTAGGGRRRPGRQRAAAGRKLERARKAGAGADSPRLPPPRPPSQRLLPEGGGRTATARKTENRPDGA